MVGAHCNARKRRCLIEVLGKLLLFCGDCNQTRFGCADKRAVSITIFAHARQLNPAATCCMPPQLEMICRQLGASENEGIAPAGDGAELGKAGKGHFLVEFCVSQEADRWKEVNLRDKLRERSALTLQLGVQISALVVYVAV